MINSFKEFNFKPFINQALTELHFETPTPVQAKLIPVIEKGKNVIGKSATGSGKTHAFLLPIFEQLDVDDLSVQAVITTPSRELAYQIYENAKQIANQSAKTIHIANYVGGTDKKRQLDKLANEQPQIVIGTPGRILDLLNSQALDIHTAKRLVVDEADMTFDLGFLPDVDQIAARFGKDLQMMVFSATLPQTIQPFLKKYMENPVIEEIPVASVISENVSNWLISTKGQDKNDLIYQLVTMGEPYLALIFANTRQRVEEIHQYLRGQGLKVGMIQGGMKPRERKRIMKQVQNLEFQYVVATDLAARGIDIDGISMVINDDIPEDLTYFVHRVGRTGRGKLKGTAITLYAPNEEDKIDELDKMGIEFQPKMIKNHELVDSYDRNRRKTRRHPHDKLDVSMIGLIKKKKKNIKPGYKRKIKSAIKENDELNRKLSRQQADRQRRKDRKKSSKRYR